MHEKAEAWTKKLRHQKVDSHVLQLRSINEAGEAEAWMRMLVQPNLPCSAPLLFSRPQANFSSFGSPVVHMGAPGWSIMSTFFTNTSGSE